jgi:Ca-activated chloride channel family protein
MFRYIYKRPLIIALALLILSLVASHAQKSAAQSSPQEQADKNSSTSKQEQQPTTRPQPKFDSQSDGPLKLSTDLVTLTVTVTDPYNRLVTGLDRQHFEVFEDKVKQSIEFFNDDDVPVSMGIIFDVSGKHEGKGRPSARGAQSFCRNQS